MALITNEIEIFEAPDDPDFPKWRRYEVKANGISLGFFYTTQDIRPVQIEYEFVGRYNA